MDDINIPANGLSVDFRLETINLVVKVVVQSARSIFTNQLHQYYQYLCGQTINASVLFGFGADSFIEVMSGIGIALMILRIKKYPTQGLTLNNLTFYGEYLAFKTERAILGSSILEFTRHQIVLYKSKNKFDI